MACYRPVLCWLPDPALGEGNRPVFRLPVNAGDYDELRIPCRKCEGCLLDIARDYSVRAAHEAQMHPHSCFVTLTYDPAHLPFRGDLSKAHYLAFVRAVKNEVRSVRPRFLGVGEYGSRTGRAHYHVCVFGRDWFADAVPAGKSSAGFPCFESPRLTGLWGRGRVIMNFMGPEVAEYAARYSLKALRSGRAGVSMVDPVTGHPFTRAPEFLSASKQLGRSWLERFSSDVFPHDFVVMRSGRKAPVPRYYVRVLREWCEEDYQALMARRLERLAVEPSRVANATLDRLAVRRHVTLARLDFSRRGL